MARFSVILSIAVVALVVLYTNQVLGDGVVAVNGSDAPTCYKQDSSDCKGKIPGCMTPCCNLKYGVAENGSLWAIGYGTCTCCAKNHCEYGFAAGNATNPNTGADAEAFSQRCTLAA